MPGAAEAAMAVERSRAIPQNKAAAMALAAVLFLRGQPSTRVRLEATFEFVDGECRTSWRSPSDCHDTERRACTLRELAA